MTESDAEAPIAELDPGLMDSQLGLAEPLQLDVAPMSVKPTFWF